MQGNITPERQSKHQVINWQGRPIRLSYDPNYFDGVAHVEIYAGDEVPLPIAETGYKSHFFMTNEPPLMKDIICFVVDWLDKESKTKDWQDHIRNTAQYELF